MANVFIKKPGSEDSYTDEQIQELLKCKNDLIFFATNYIKVVNPVKGLISWEPRDYQLRMIDGFINERFNIIMASRQVGKTTVALVYMLWKAMFHGNLDIAILANKFLSAKEVLDRIKEAYEHIPSWLKPGAETFSATQIIFENGSRITCNSTSKDSIRGRSCSIVYLDEFAHVAPSVAKEFWISNFPTISTGGQLIIVSTPNGVGNLYHEIWSRSIKAENNFHNCRVDWHEVEGRDAAWRDRTINDLGSIILFNQEYGNAFLGSVETLIDYKALQDLVGANPILSKDEGRYAEWEAPQEKHKYLVSVDAAEGKGGDHSVIQIFDITKIPWNQVARYRSNAIALVDLPYKVKEMADKYNEAHIVVESNGIGKGVLNDLWHGLNYPKVVHMGKKPEDLGVISNKGSKAEACGYLKKAVENKWINFNDDVTIAELFDFGAKGGRYQALNGHDDLAMSAAWACIFNKSLDFNSLGKNNMIEFFDFKKGTHVIDNTEVVAGSVITENLTVKDMVDLLRHVDNDEIQELRNWLIS